MKGIFHNELSRFLVVGFATVGVDYLSYQLFLAFGLPVALAKSSGFITGTVFAYFANKLWTFSGSTPAKNSAFRFSVIYASTLALNVLVNSFVLHLLAGFPSAVQIAFVIATGASATANFLGMKFYVFRNEQHEGHS